MEDPQSELSTDRAADPAGPDSQFCAPQRESTVDAASASGPAADSAAPTPLPETDVSASNGPSVEGPVTVGPATEGPDPTAAPTPQPPGATYEDAARSGLECSAALEAFLASCLPFPAFQDPWAWLSARDGCRRTPANPAATLAHLREEFPDRVLRAAQLVTGPAESPTLHPSLMTCRTGYVFPVRATPGGPLVDLLTDRGVLSSADIPISSVPILPARCGPLPENGIVFGTVDPDELAVLHSLDLPAVLLRRARGMSLTGLRDCGTFQIPIVAGCRSLAANVAAPTSESPPLWLVVLGFRLLELGWQVPRGMRAVLRFVEFVRDTLHVDLSEAVLVAAPPQDQLDQLAQQLSWHDTDLVRRWLLDQALSRLVNWDRYHAWCVPDSADEQPLRNYDVVRREIIALLEKKSPCTSDDLDELHNLRDELRAAVDSQMDALLQTRVPAGDVMAGLPMRLLVSTFRPWLIVEPFAQAARTPPQLQLGIDLDGLSVHKFFDVQSKKLSQLLRTHGSRWRQTW